MKPLLIVYSSLGLGGIPTRLVDIINRMAIDRPQVPIVLLLKKKPSFDRRSTIVNPRCDIRDFSDTKFRNSATFYTLWLWANIFRVSPQSILTCLSPYAIPVLCSKFIFFWMRFRAVVNEGHYTSSHITTMRMPVIQRIGVRQLYPVADWVIVPTHAVGNDLSKRYAVPDIRIQRVKNWSRYAGKKISKNTRPIDLVYLGRFEQSKRVLGLLMNVKRLVKSNSVSEVRLYGSGSQRMKYRRYIANNGLGTHVSLHKPILNVSTILSQSKIFVFNTSIKSEGFPVAMLDAMACGAIVVTSYFEGVEEVLIDGVNGYITKSDDEFIDRIVHVLRDYKHLEKVRNAARKTIEDHHSTDNIARYMHLLNL